jgi:hypothetical protein
MSVNPTKVPATAKEWRMKAVNAGIDAMSIFDMESYESGSNISHNQFLLLRVLWLKEDLLYPIDQLVQLINSATFLAPYVNIYDLINWTTTGRCYNYLTH